MFKAISAYQAFEREYAERSGVTVKWLRRHCVVRPCHCDYAECVGWQSIPKEARLRDARLYRWSWKWIVIDYIVRMLPSRRRA